MKRRTRILAISLFVGVLGASCWFFWPPSQVPEPVYQSKPLSAWLEDYVLMGHGTPGEGEQIAAMNHAVDEVVRRIGTNAVPALVAMLNATDSPLRKFKVFANEHHLHSFDVDWVPAVRGQLEAVYALRALGADAGQAVPTLLKMYRRNAPDGSRELAAYAFGGIGPPASNAVPFILQTVANVGPMRAWNSFRALGDIHADPEHVVPVLVKYLKDPEPSVRKMSVVNLKKFGTNAVQTLPALKESLSDEDERVKIMAAQAIKSIDPEAAAKAGIK